MTAMIVLIEVQRVLVLIQQNVEAGAKTIVLSKILSSFLVTAIWISVAKNTVW